jgi:pyruvate dehydrogenase E1 component alpha subunit
VQAGACTAVRDDDYLLYAHRGITYLTAKGMSPDLILGDFHGRLSGSTRGLGAGTIHCVDPAHGVMGQGGTLGSCFALSAGLGLASQLLGQDRVALAFFGDGASARGTFLESAVSAVAWKLPLVWICENNGWAVSVPLASVQGTNQIAGRAEGMGLFSQVVDGQDALAVRRAVEIAVGHARSGAGPAFIEAMTARVHGHYAGDTQTYRESSSIDVAGERDPIELAGERLVGAGVPVTELTSIAEQAATEMRAADERARQSPRPTAARLDEGLYV